MKKIYQLWLILAAYGVWFAVLSGLEEMVNGKYWKLPLALLLGLVTYYWLENRVKKS